MRRKSGSPGGRRITVHVAWRKDRNTFILRAVDLSSQPPRQLESRSANTSKRKEADRLASSFLEEMEAKYQACPDGSVSWLVVCQRYDAEELSGQSAGGRNKFWNAVNKLDATVNPLSLYAIDGDCLSRFRGAMQQEGLAQDTIIGYLAEIGRCLNWAAGVWQDYHPPKIRKPKRKTRKGPRGRPITREEFERMLRKVKAVVGPEHARGWRRLLVGLWLSGLRISEALALAWGPPARVYVVRLDAKRTRLYFHDQKSHKEGESPITGGFRRFLRKTPPAERKGFVFSPRLGKGRVCRDTASRTIAEIGREAGVIVGTRTVLNDHGQPEERTLFASAHDLRRSFATRLAPKLGSGPLLAKYLRDTYQTAEQYYVSLGIEDAERALRKKRNPKSHAPSEGKASRKRKSELSKTLRSVSEYPGRDSNTQPTD